MEPFQARVGKTFATGEKLITMTVPVPKGKILMVEHFAAEITLSDTNENLNFIELGMQLGKDLSTYMFPYREQHGRRFVVNQPIRAYANPLTPLVPANVIVTCGRDIGTGTGGPATFGATVTGQLFDAT